MNDFLSNTSTIATEGLFPMISMISEWLLHDGLFLGLMCIVIPLCGRLFNIFKKIF